MILELIVLCVLGLLCKCLSVLVVIVLLLLIVVMVFSVEMLGFWG